MTTMNASADSGASLRADAPSGHSLNCLSRAVRWPRAPGARPSPGQVRPSCFATQNLGGRGGNLSRERPFRGKIWGMVRKAFRMAVNPGGESEYERRHRPTWPDLEEVRRQ